MSDIYHVGFTGTQAGMTPDQSVAVMRVLYALSEERWSSPYGTNPNLKFHHGDCIGADEEAACHAHGVGFTVVGHPPLEERKRAYYESDTTEQAKDYLTRNHDIVDASNEMIAAPKHHYEEVRSGTWATIRYAAKIKKPLTVVWPDGTHEHR